MLLQLLFCNVYPLLLNSDNYNLYLYVSNIILTQNIFHPPQVCTALFIVIVVVALSSTY